MVRLDRKVWTITTKICGNDVPGQGRARDNAKAAQRHPRGYPERHGESEAPSVDRAARDLLGLERDRDERGLGHCRRKADCRGKDVDQQVVVPVDAVGQTRFPDCLGRGELARHGLADGEEGLLQANEEERESQQDEDKPGRDPAQVRQVAAQHGNLEQNEDADNGCHIERGGKRGDGNSAQKFHLSSPCHRPVRRSWASGWQTR